MGGGSQSTSVQVPAWLEEAAQRNLSRADELAQIGYTPYYGPDVAALTPMQVAAMQGTNQAAGAFGMPTADPMAGMPRSQNYGGMQAYSSGGMYDRALRELETRMPGQYDALMAPFINPVTGERPLAPYGSRQPETPVVPTTPTAPVLPPSVTRPDGTGNEGRPDLGSRDPAGSPYGGGGLGRDGAMGGYTGLRDVFNGGGPGASGSTFGGALGGISNFAGLSPISRDANGGNGGSGQGGGK